MTLSVKMLMNVTDPSQVGGLLLKGSTYALPDAQARELVFLSQAAWATSAPTDPTSRPNVYVDEAGTLRKTTDQSPVQGVTNGASSPWLTRVPTIGQFALNTGLLGFTEHSMWEVEAPFDAIQVPLLNFDTAQAQTYDIVKVAVASSAADPRNSAATYVPVLFSGGASAVVPAATTVNGRVYPGVLLSDPVYISSVDRSDGGTRPLVCIRTLMSSGAGKQISVWTTNGSTGWESASAERLIASRYQTGDFVTSATTNFTDNTVRTISAHFGIRYRVRRPVAIGIACFGDSITRGVNAETVQRAWHYKTMVALSSTTRPIDYMNLGVSQATWDEFAACAATWLPLFKPSFAMAPVWCPNDGPTAVANMRTSLVKFLETCRANGVTPILWEGTPRSTGANTTPYYTQSEDLTRTAWLTAGAAYAARVIRTSLGLSSGSAEPYAYASGYTTDGLHPNAVGDSALSALMQPTFSTLQSQVYA